MTARASAMVIGAGALGSPAATYLACAGVGRVGIVDGGDVELAGLARQPLHFRPDLGRSKAESAAQKLGVLNTDITVEPYPVDLDEQNAGAIVAGADVVLDCSNSAATRYLVNDACCQEGVPFVTASMHGFAGTVLAVRPGESACWRCAFPDAGSGDADEDVLGAVAGVLGSLQALEALKLLTGVGKPPGDTVVQFDGLTLTQMLVHTSRRADCTACAGIPAASHSA